MTDPFFASAIDPLDAVAREAFRTYCDDHRHGCEAVARIHGMAPRTVERIYAGGRDVPPQLAREIANRLSTNVRLRSLPSSHYIAVLHSWADRWEKERRNG